MTFLKKHLYITTTIVAIIIAIVAWIMSPKEYAAQIKLGDEYKETDLAIGLDHASVTIRDLIGFENKGINDVEVYCKILKTPEFAKKIAKTKIKNSTISYGKYLNTQDTLNKIIEKIDYNLQNKNQNITIQFVDKDPIIAAQMLDSITKFLQISITESKQKYAKAQLNSAIIQRNIAHLKYEKAQKKYANFKDSQNDITIDSEQIKESAYAKEINDSYDLYKKAAIKCERYKMLSKRPYMSFAVIKGITVPNDKTPKLIGYILFAILTSIIGTKFYKLYKIQKRNNEPIKDFGGITSPWNITIAVWGAICIAMPFRDPAWLNAPSKMFYYTLTCWLVCFCFSSFLTYIMLPTKYNTLKEISENSASPIELTKINNLIFNCLFALSIIITPLYLKKIMDVVLMFGTDKLLLNLRDLAVSGGEQSFLNYSIVINEVLMIVGLWAYPHIKLWKVILVCSACLLNSLAIMEKGGILLILFCIVFILYQRKYIKTRTIAFLGILVILLSYGFNLIRQSSDAIDYENDDSIFNFIAMYLLSPPVAYCTLHREIIPQFGAHTFPLIYLFLNKFGFGNYVFFDRTQEFVFVPVSTNVYTIFQPFYMDFGYTGIIIFAIIYGIMTGWAYRSMRNGNAFGKCFYMYLAYALVLQFFQEYIFTGNMHIVQLIILILLCTQKKITFIFKK